MAYLTQAQLEQRIGAKELLQLSDREGARQINEDVVAAALADADAEANAYIGAQYELPLTSTPEIVRALVASIARYNLFSRNLREDHGVYIAYRDALRTLERIAAGAVVLPITEGAAEETPAGGFTSLTPETHFDTVGLL